MKGCPPTKRSESTASAEYGDPCRPDRRQHDAAFLALGGQVPGSVIGHRTLDGEQAGVEVGDDQKEWLGRIAAASGSMTGELLQREPDLQSDLIALNLAVLDRTAHLRDFEPAEIS